MRKIFENLHKFWTNERKTGEDKKTGINFMYLLQFNKVSHVFMSFLPHISAQNFQSVHLIAQKNPLLESLLNSLAKPIYLANVLTNHVILNPFEFRKQ